jgi:hypothetical protein
MTPQKPVHVGKIRDHDVRFFQPQSDHDSLPWVAEDDLQRAIGVPRPFRRVLAHEPLGRVSIRTASGLTPVLSFDRSTALIQASIHYGWTTDADHLEYADHLGKATAEIYPELWHDHDGDLAMSSADVAELLRTNHEDVVNQITDIRKIKSN